MRKLAYPSWNDWTKHLESLVADAMKHTGLTDYRINGAATSLQVPIKAGDRNVARLPYVQLILSGVESGHDDENSAQEDYQKSRYLDIGGGTQIKQGEIIRERLTWTIEGFANKRDEAVSIAETIKKYFNTRGFINILWQGVDDYAYTELHDYSIEAAEADREGNIEFYRVSWLLTVLTKSELLVPDERIRAISDTIVETVVTQDGGDTESNFTKTIS